MDTRIEIGNHKIIEKTKILKRRIDDLRRLSERKIEMNTEQQKANYSIIDKKKSDETMSDFFSPYAQRLYQRQKRKGESDESAQGAERTRTPAHKHTSTHQHELTNAHVRPRIQTRTV